MTVTITDLGAAAELSAFATAINVQSDKQTATGYEKVSTIDGRLTNGAMTPSPRAASTAFSWAAASMWRLRDRA